MPPKLLLLVPFLFCLLLNSASFADQPDGNLSNTAPKQNILKRLADIFDPYFSYRHRFLWENQTGEPKTRVGEHRIIAGVRVRPHEDALITVGISSGGEDPRTTNHTYARKWEKPEIRLHQLNLKLDPVKQLKLVGGKFSIEEAFWSPSTVLWDTTIAPLGGTATVSHEFLDQLGAWLSGGYLAVKELQHKKKPPQLLYAQGGSDYKSGDFFSRIALAFFGTTNPKETAFKFSEGTNTKVCPSMKNKYRFNVLSPSLEAGVKELAKGYVPYAGVFIQAAHNLSAKSKNSALITGVTIGSQFAPEKQGEWRAQYEYKYMQADAFMDTFTDGGTNKKGHRFAIEYSPINHFLMAVTYYRNREVTGSRNLHQILEVDGEIFF